MSSAYLCAMIARLVTMLAILAITVVTTVASAHAARMGMRSDLDPMMHGGAMMMYGADGSMAACDMTACDMTTCDKVQPSGAADAGLCEFVCQGVSLVLNMPMAQAEPAYGPAAHDLPAAEIHTSRAQKLNKRPPRLRLL